MVSNKEVLADEDGDYNDWMEICNTGDKAINLEGFGITDNQEKPFKWQFPSLVLEPGEHLLLYASGKDRKADKKALHTNFKLKPGEETLFLYSKDGVLLDTLKLKEIPDNMSYGRDPQSENRWLYYLEATPGLPNGSKGNLQPEIPPDRIYDSPVWINEYMSDNEYTLIDEDGDFSDWIEVYNSGDTAVNLEGYGLSDDPDNLLKWQFPPLVLQPGQYVLVFASGKDRRDPFGPYLHTNFKLKNGEEILFFSNEKGQILDQLVLQETRDGVSYGRDLVHSQEWLYFTSPTPAGPNTTQGFESLPQEGFITSTKELLLSEAMALNQSALADGDGEYPDWIEITNQGPEPIDLTGYGLSTKKEDLFYWTFPETQIEPGEYLIVFASGKNCSDKEGYLHTNFKLNPAGEMIFLTHPSGRVVDVLDTGYLTVDRSSGRSESGGNRVFFEWATPGAANRAPFYRGYALDPQFSAAGGYYEEPLELYLTSRSPDAVIRYTLDGSEPTGDSPLYSGPILLTSTTVVRAKAFEDGRLPSRTVTHTFLMEPRHTLPVVSIAVDPADMWDPETGIYEMGPNASEEFPYLGANFWQDIEKPIHMEYFDEEGKLGFSLDAGFKIFGAYSRAMDQKSFAIFARDRYGQDEIVYPLFPDKPLLYRFESIVLRTSGQDATLTKIRDSMMARLVKDTGLDYQAYRPVVLYIDGQYWGLYNIREKVNEAYLASNHGVDPDDIDLLEGNSRVKAGDAEDYEELLKFVKTHDMSLKENYEAVKQRIDIQNYIDYQCAIIYFGNTDTGNIRYWRERSPNGKWRWIVYDQDWGFFNVEQNTLWYVTNPQGTGVGLKFSTALMVNLLKNEEFKNEFIQRFAYHLNHTFKTEHVLAVIDEMAKAIEPEMPRHLSRWGGSMKSWHKQVEVLRDFARRRPEILKGYFQRKFNLSKEEMRIFDAS